MPGNDGTGPMGMGPMTGRAAGICAGFEMPGYMNPIPGCGRGRRGGGCGPSAGLRAGWRNMFHATGLTGWQRAGAGWPVSGGVQPYAAPTKEQELEALKSQAEYLESALGNIRTRLQEVETQKA